MKTKLATILATCLLAVGCDNPSAKPPVAAPPSNSNVGTPVSPPDVAAPPDIKMPDDKAGQPAVGDPTTAAAIPTAAPEGFTPVRVDAGVVQLTPENTTFQVIGRHAAPRGGPNDPNARTIVFEKFTGKLTVDPATKLPKSAVAEIDATSLVAFDPGLTSHLKNREFIDVEAFPAIKFESTRVEPSAEPGKVEIVGNLTLHGVTKEIKVPATVTNGPDGATVHGTMTLNRRDFDIKHANIDNAVMPEMDFTIFVGKKTERPAPGPPRRRRGGDGG